MKKSSKKSKIPFWLQITVILLTGVLASGIIFFIVKEQRLPVYTLTFAYQDGTVIDTREVKEGKGVFPPEFEHEGVFRGWDSGINHVEDNNEVHPMLYAIVEDNLFYFDSLYVKEGKEFTVDVRLDGKVNISACDITLEYDSDVMKFKSSESESFAEVNGNEKGKVTLKLQSDSPLQKATSITRLTFRAKRADVFSSEITLTAENGITIAKGKEVPAIFATINNKIYFLQEVM